jgi:hypothetical protein
MNHAAVATKPPKRETNRSVMPMLQLDATATPEAAPAYA